MEPKAGKAKANVNVVKVNDLVALIRKGKPGLLGKMPDAKAVNIIRAGLVQLGRQLNSVNEGVVRVPVLGNFRIAQVEREKGGKKETVRRVVFKAAAPKPKKGKAA